MLNYYKTINKLGIKEIVIKKSRFIGYAKPIQTEDEAHAFIQEMNKKHYDATHNCYAYVLGERDQIQKQSDDGEPSGTAGKPILEVIKNQQLKNVCVIVTRYFGGIMLGAGGLIRAYTDGAVAGIDAAEAITQVLHQKVHITVDYTWHGKLENEFRTRGVLVDRTDFTDKVTICCLPYRPNAEAFVNWVTDITQGQAHIDLGDTLYVAHPMTWEPPSQ